MNLVESALRRPYTVVVIAVALALGAWLAAERMARDIFPSLGVPTIYVAQPFGGMDPAQMEGYLTYYYEYHFLYITGIEHVESKSIQGAALIKLQFHPGTDMAAAMAETVSYVNRARAFMPPGTVPPFVMRFDAGSVPVGQLVFASDTKTVGQLQDAALNLVRPLFATLPGVSAPPPFGGSARSILVNLKPDRLRAYQISPDEIVAAVSAANTISPSGNLALGGQYPMVPMNAVVKTVKELEALPLRTGVYPAIYLRDVGEVVDGSDLVTSYALVNGRRTVYIPVTKRADASTLAVVALVKQNLAKFQSVLPDGVKVSYELDQSPLVTRAIASLVREGVLGAVLTGLMILLFLRDWRSAAVVVVNIPLALFGALLALWATGQTINLMTLGGLALAVGILVDEATVAVENMHTHLARGERLAGAALAAVAETAVPRFLAMLCVLAVFIPAFFMTGAARALFVPLALAVGFAMIASFLLSSTLAPVLAVWWLRPAAPGASAGHGAGGAWAGFQAAFGRWSAPAVRARWVVVPVYLAACAGVILLAVGHLGVEIFPRVDAGQFQLRLRAPAGTRLELTEQIATNALAIIRDTVGPDNLALSMGLVGVHASAYPVNFIHQWNSGPEEAVLQIQLRPGAPVRIEALQETLRGKLTRELPGVRWSFEPGDLVSRVMSFGSPTPVAVAVSGPNLAANLEHAQKIQAEMAKIPALRDLQIAQTLDYPTVDINFNRERAGLLGVKTIDAARSLVEATSSSRFTTPNYWADPNTGVSYLLQVQIPQAKMETLEDVKNIPLTGAGGRTVLLRNVAGVTKGATAGEYERYNMQRTISLTANLSGADLGRVQQQVAAAIAAAGAPPPRVTVTVRGQAVPLQEMLTGLRTGLGLAVGVIFLLLAAYFQSPRLALVVVSTVPAVAAGVVLTLWATGTTLNLQSFMGMVMAVGVAVANAILLVTYAERARLAGGTAGEAAVAGVAGRLRPILMTSLAMIAGMIPLAAGWGEGAEQAAPLGRAVAGGLAAATVATLLILPAVFALAQGRASRRSASLSPRDPASDHYLPPGGGSAPVNA